MTIETSELPPGYWVDQRTGALQTLPWPNKPEEKVEIARHSLGPLVMDWAEGKLEAPGLVHHLTGHPWRFTDGQRRFLLRWYELGPNGRWRWRSAVKRGAKGTGKDPFAAAICLIELLGPCRFDGWAAGRPLGAAHRMPLVQIAANSEAQAKDVLRVANVMLNAEARAWYGIDAGETRTTTQLGRLEVLTFAERSTEGDPATFIALNESHHMTESSGGHRLARVARRNVGKSPADLQARLCEFTNAHQRGQDSVAEQSYDAWQLQISGRARRQDILYDSIEAPDGIDLQDDSARMAGLRAAYSDAPWSDLERISDEMLDPRTPVAETIRYYLNGLATAEDAWVDPSRFDQLAQPDLVLPSRELALFLDCSKTEDATALMGCELVTGHCLTLGVWQRPRGTREWQVPRVEVDTRVREIFSSWDVCWFGVDPSPARDDDDQHLFWMELIDGWHRDLGRKLRRRGHLWATPGIEHGHSVLFDMRTSSPGGKERVKEFTAAAEQTAHDIDIEGSLTWDGDPMLRAHVHNAKQRPNPWGISLGKESRDSSNLVDLAVSLVGARLGRRRVLNIRVKKAAQGGGIVGF